MSIGKKYRDIINRMLDLTDNDDPEDLADTLRSLSASFTELAKRQNSEAAKRALSAEMARVVANMRGRLGAMGQQPDKECNEAADLLERLAGELTEITADRDGWKQQHENLLHVRQTDIENLAAKIERLEAALGKSAIDLGISQHKHGQAEAKLAERETELAKADAVVNAMTGSDFYTYGGRGERQRLLTEWYEQAVARHAARQQQKASAEPTDAAKEG